MTKLTANHEQNSPLSLVFHSPHCAIAVSYSQTYPWLAIRIAASKKSTLLAVPPSHVLPTVSISRHIPPSLHRRPTQAAQRAQPKSVYRAGSSSLWTRDIRHQTPPLRNHLSFPHLSFTSCYYSSRFGPQGVLATGFAPASLSTPYFPHSAVIFSPSTTPFSALPSRSSLSRPTSTITNLSPPQHSETLSASAGETRKLIIGLVLAIAIVFLLVTMGSARLCIMRKRQRRKDEFAKAHRDVDKSGGECENPQLYLQQKAELDDEQRRHEMEAVKLRYETQGADEIHELDDEMEAVELKYEMQEADEIPELPAEKCDRHCGE